ncbi:MAG: SDR family NAD(P)-dependent oxidoreductase [Desulfovibrionaceae bacterium]
MAILITGSAGFIGFSIARKLLKEGYHIIGIDSLSDYYDVSLKKARNAILDTFSSYVFYHTDIADKEAIDAIFKKHSIKYVLNLAAQAGVRYSIVNPSSYIATNLVGFSVILEACRTYGVSNFVYASSSSVYGLNDSVPFSEAQKVDSPISLYAATKKSNELMAHSYSHLYGIPTTGIRFFTLYGPYGRPDMALFSFTKAIYAGEAIQLYNNGDMFRDFTYIDDCVSALQSMIFTPTRKKDSSPPYAIYNVGNNKCVSLQYFVSILEKAIGIEAKKEYLPMQDGDVYKTYADISAAKKCFGFTPFISIEEGIPRFVDWYKKYHSI